MTEPDPDELEALRERAGLCRHGLRFLVDASGADVVAWLERLASNPMADIAAGEARRATLMDGKGKLRADLRVLAPGEPRQGLLLDLPASHEQALMRLLDMYIIQDDVVLSDRSADLDLVSLFGPQCEAVLERAGLPVPADGRVVRPRDGLLLARSRLAGVPGIDLIVARRARDDLESELIRAGASMVGADALDVVRLEQGVPWFGPDLSDGVIPLEALLDADVSITKGCYPGQEVVARIQNLGQVARKLARLVASGSADVPAGAELLTADGKPAGVVTSAAHDPVSQRTLALGYVKRAAWSSGSVVRAGDVELTVESLDGD